MSSGSSHSSGEAGSTFDSFSSRASVIEIDNSGIGAPGVSGQTTSTVSASPKATDKQASLALSSNNVDADAGAGGSKVETKESERMKSVIGDMESSIVNGQENVVFSSEGRSSGSLLHQQPGNQPADKMDESAKKSSEESGGKTSGLESFPELVNVPSTISLQSLGNGRKEASARHNADGAYAAKENPSGSKVCESESAVYVNLKFVHRLGNYPVVDTGCSLYKQVKENTQLFVPLSLMEFGAVAAFFPVAVMVSPFLYFCSKPASAADWLLCKGLDAAETVFPCISVPPNQMCGVTKKALTGCVCCCPRAVKRGVTNVCYKDESA